MQARDALTLDAPQKTRDGFLKVRARAARTGIYDYAGHEVDPRNEHGLRDKQTVKVYRPGDQVFDRASLASFIGKPITDDHPTQPVTRDNWRDHARGTIMGAVRDGEYVAFDLMLTDGATIDAIEAGKRELSNGYATDLKFESGTAPDGTAYDAVQTSISGNHIALVDKGRAGSDCRISDGERPAFAVCDANPAAVADLQPKDKAMKKIVLDGLQVDLTDADAVAAAFDKLQATNKELADAKAKAETDLATVTTDKAKLEAEKTTLEKQVADAQLTPAQLRDAAKAYAQTVDKAKALGVTVADDADEPAIRKAVVSAKIGDAAKDWSDDQIAVSFATLTADVKPVVANLTPGVTHDAQTARDAARNDYIANLTGKKEAA